MCYGYIMADASDISLLRSIGVYGGWYNGLMHRFEDVRMSVFGCISLNVYFGRFFWSIEEELETD